MDTHISRRRFLQSAVLGVAALEATPQLIAKAQALPDVEVAGGVLVSRGNGWIEVSGDELHPFTLTTTTEIWKGGAQPASALSEGDSLVVRYDPRSDQALAVWSNLARVSGQVVGSDPSRYTLRPVDTRGPQGETRLRISERAQLSPQSPQGPNRRASNLYVGDVVDVVGERTPNGVLATMLDIIPQLPAVPAAERAPNSYVKAGPSGCEYYGWLGYVSFYACSTGSGRCATCNTANSSQLAWPAIDYCGCCDSSCCDCSRNCNDQCYASCGDVITVFDNSCTSKQRNCSVVDCGPCRQNNCSSCTNLCNRVCKICGTQGVGAVADLTVPTFTYFYSPSVYMCFAATVQTACTNRCN